MNVLVPGLRYIGHRLLIQVLMHMTMVDDHRMPIKLVPYFIRTPFSDSLIFQALINLAVVTATVPFTGIPLPFISFGGSSLVISMIGVGLILAVSRGTLPKEAEHPEDQDKAVNRASYDLRRWDRGSRVPRSGRRRLADSR